MDFASVFRLLISNFQKEKIDFALIGGFALHSAGLSRSTQDIDFLVDDDDRPRLKELMLNCGYKVLHESQDVSNYVGKLKELGRVDFLHAHRKYARKMLGRAKQVDILEGRYKVKVLLAEDLIGLKVQSSSNDPARYHQDMADIEYLLRANQNLNLNLVREYFMLFERSEELDTILKRIKDDNR